MFKNHLLCRVCGSDRLIPYLDLGLMPLSNNLCETKEEQPARYPLKVLFCQDCSLSQLSVVVDPETLFGHYVYRSSMSQGYKDHCKEMAVTLKEKYGLNKDSFHIDIAGNDGALLHEFNQVIGCRVLNIDPAANMVKICEDKGIRQFTKFWGKEAALHLVNTGWPKADLITATNVFAHCDNVKEFLEAAKMVLAPEGVLVLEFPYLVDFIEKNEFDTVYFEHLSYFSISPLVDLVKGCGMNIIEVEHVDIHGGSVRVSITIEGVLGDSVYKYVDKEMLGKYHRLSTYYDWSFKVNEVINNFRRRITLLKLSGNKIAGFAASAKGNTLLNSAGITNEVIDYIIDETPEKQGKYSPGTHIPIVPMGTEWPDYLVILSWNFADEIIGKCKENGYTGRFILPLTFDII